MNTIENGKCIACGKRINVEKTLGFLHDSYICVIQALGYVLNMEFFEVSSKIWFLKEKNRKK